MDLHKLNSVNYYLKPFTSQAPSLLFPLQLNPSSMLVFSLVRRHYTNQFYSDVNNALTMQTFFMFPILMPKHNMSNLFVVFAHFSSSPPPLSPPSFSSLTHLLPAIYIGSIQFKRHECFSALYRLTVFQIYLPKMRCISDASATILTFAALTWIDLRLTVFTGVTWNAKDEIVWEKIEFSVD